MEQFLEEFRHTIEDAAHRLAARSDAGAARPAKPGAWSAREILGHLIDSAANNHRRFVEAQFRDDLEFPGYEQEGWVTAQRYDTADWLLLVELWRAYNLHLVHVVSAMSRENLERARTPHSLHRTAWRELPAGEPATLEYLVHDYLGHMRHHLNQIFALPDVVERS